MLEAKAHHKELKRAVNEVEDKRRTDRTNQSWFEIRTLKKVKPVNEVEDKRRTDRTNQSWFEIRTLKKVKLKAKDKLNGYKQIKRTT